MATENDWGAPRVHGELTKLGYAIDESTVSNDMPTCPTPQSTVENWKQFLKKHSEFIYATDFFFVPTAFFRNLYILFVVHHESRCISGTMAHVLPVNTIDISFSSPTTIPKDLTPKELPEMKETVRPSLAD